MNIPSGGSYKINGVDITSTLKLKQSTGVTYNPANPFVFDKEYQYNNYTLTSNITPTYSLTNAVPLTFTQITFIGDGIHTVDFSNFTESDLSGTFDTTLGVENKVVFYYDGYDILYSVISAARIATSSITGLLSSTDWTTFNSKQAALVSGTNIKTINSTTILGSGNIAVQPTLVSGTNIKTINGTSVLGSGDIVISSGVTPTDNIFDWDGTNNWYAPYTSKQASMSFYTGTTAPTLTDRLNLDGKLYSSGFSVTTGSTNTVGFQCVTNTGSAYGVYVNNNVGDGIYVLNSSSSSGIKIDNGSTVGLLVNNNSSGEGIKIQYSGSNRVSNFLNLTKSQSGTQDADGHFIKITDNSTTSGTISGKVLTASISGAERISLNPRVTNSGTNKAYILDTHNTLSGTTELLSIQNNTVERFRVTPTNTALPAGTSTTFATVGGVLKDFYTDVSTSGTSETDLYSYTIPANTLTTIGDKLIFKVYLNKTGIGSGSYVNFYLGGSALASSTYAVLSTGYGVECEILIIYTSASSAKIRYSYKGYTYTECYNNTSLAVNWTTTNVLKFVGRADTGSISVTEGYIEYKPAAIN